MKLGLAPVDGINRVVLRKDKTLLFVVPNPEVFRKGDTWVVLGEARVEDPNQRAREMAAAKVAENIQPKTKVSSMIRAKFVSISWLFSRVILKIKGSSGVILAIFGIFFSLGASYSRSEFSRNHARYNQGIG